MRAAAMTALHFVKRYTSRTCVRKGVIAIWALGSVAQSRR
jgi:hypothetical protein